MSEFILGCFYTKNSPYEEVFHNYLKKSIDKYKLNYIVVETQDYNNWYQNVAEKPKVILDILSSTLISNKNLLFLDVDCTIEKSLDLFNNLPEEYDIAYHTLSWNFWYGYHNKPDVKELLSGTMWFKNTPIIKELCLEWYKKAKESNEWEQKVLSKVIQPYIANGLIKPYALPLEYCYMNSRPRGQLPLIKLDPYIVHYQKSRELKKYKK